MKTDYVKMTPAQFAEFQFNLENRFDIAVGTGKIQIQIRSNKYLCEDCLCPISMATNVCDVCYHKRNQRFNDYWIGVEADLEKEEKHKRTLINGDMISGEGMV